MKRLVLDAPVLASWFVPGGPDGRLRGEYEGGLLTVVGPRHLPEDLLGEIARRTGMDAAALERVGLEIDRLGLQLRTPSRGELARWIAAGLPAHRAAYVAVASEADLVLVTDDDVLRDAAGPRATRPEEA